MPRFIAAALLCFTIALVTGCVSADAPASLRRDAPGVSFAVGGIIRGGGLDDAGNSGSTGDLWPPSGWQFIPGAARGEIVGVPGTPDACLTDGFCFLGAVVTMLGDLGVPLNPDPNPGPNNTPSTHFGYMATSNFFRHGDSVVARKSGIQKDFTLPANAGWLLNFDYAFLSGQLNTGPGHNDFAVVQLLLDGQTFEVFRISRNDLQPGGSGPTTPLHSGSCGSTQFGSAPGLDPPRFVYSQLSLCTGWRAARIEVSQFAGRSFTLRLFVEEGGPDNDVGTFFAFDNLKFDQVNLLPVVALSPPVAVAIGTPTAVAASFTDGDPGDLHTAAWTWGDGTVTDPASLTEQGGSGSVADLHQFVSAGVYPVTITVTDTDGGAGSAQQFAVVYDPAGGFVTGGGWIDSPVVPSLPYMTVGGKATFGFVSKYQTGKTVPTGNTQFSLHAAGLHFVSTTYDWLVIAGAKAQYQGTGTVNGTGDFAFRLRAIDGAVSGGGGVDRFRITIRDRSAGNAVVYDNEPGSSDDASPVTALAGGSIVIHKD